MKLKQQRIAIAEACGWHTIAFTRGWIKVGDGEMQAEIPDYLTDLNAMHEAEKVMPQAQMSVYVDHLNAVVGRDNPHGHAYWLVFNATAAQRAEAFLRALNLWTED